MAVGAITVVAMANFKVVFHGEINTRTDAFEIGRSIEHAGGKVDWEFLILVCTVSFEDPETTIAKIGQ